MRAMKIAFGILFVTVFFYAISFTLAMSHEQAVKAAEENISALAMVAQGMDGTTLKLMSLMLNIFSVMTAFFGVYLGFRDSCQGLAMLALKKSCLKRRSIKTWSPKESFSLRFSWRGVHCIESTSSELHISM
ncbi:inner membrane transport protein YhaO [Vibrio parahaemolyticus K5030]|nr:inner membrane transport protein YhaO [Vibrio parahaemolyticus K5030]